MKRDENKKEFVDMCIKCFSHQIEGYEFETWYEKKIDQAISQAKKETAERIVKLVDDIELENQGSTLKEWKEYKNIRNRIRDQILSESEKES